MVETNTLDSSPLKAMTDPAVNGLSPSQDAVKWIAAQTLKSKTFYSINVLYKVNKANRPIVSWAEVRFYLGAVRGL